MQNLPTVGSNDPANGEVDSGTITFPLRITDIYGISPSSLPPGRTSDEVYDVNATALMNYVKAFRLLLGRYRRLGNRQGATGGDDWLDGSV